MIDKKEIRKAFDKHGGVLKTKELNDLGLSSRQINKLLRTEEITRIKQGFYVLKKDMVPETVIIARLFPDAVLFLESALLHYGYTDRIPGAWQIAVDRDSEKSRYDIDYPPVEPFYQTRKFLDIGVTTYEEASLKIKIFDRDRTICDVLRYEKKLEKEVVTNALTRYLKDSKKNIRHLFEYANSLNIARKVQSQIGVWLYWITRVHRFSQG